MAKKLQVGWLSISNWHKTAVIILQLVIINKTQQISKYYGQKLFQNIILTKQLVGERQVK